MSFCIVDDDAASRRMLENIIEDSGIGKVTGVASGGVEGAEVIFYLKPDVVLIDLLMPDQDGIETIAQLNQRGFIGKYVMISQIENKEMVARAYQQGIEYFIQKPINRVEVEAVLRKVCERWKLDRYISEIKMSFAKLDMIQEQPPEPEQKKDVRDIVNVILMDMGIVGETGSKDILFMMEYLIKEKGTFLPLKELYEVAAQSYKSVPNEIQKESRAIEQRIRRTVMVALTNLASIGLTDYSNPKFEYYAPLYFDFQDVRLKMKEMEDEDQTGKGKVNIKKFLQVLYFETLNKFNN
ncbi:histidine kinase [Paenibacillus beijingensis]|uniref:Histidine kinase n=1 Tax=Paenibacillus beijingensis TaxID=1126833 RepID=A0A0D5NRK8_9BACL|nr:histidine kinase [Paenibacillus beijingensis]